MKKIFSSKKELLKFLGIRENFLYSDFSNKYRQKEKSKKNGGIRLIKPPNFSLKKIQRKILDKILCNNPQLACVYGLSKEKNTLSNAKAHQKNADGQLLVLDIKDFFPNILKKSVIRVFSRMGFSKENSTILTKICTVDDCLPQGAPTSPYLASLVCLKLDKEIFIYCKRRGFLYTRYFDDISISGLKIFKKHIKCIEEIIGKNGFSCKDDKKYLFDCGAEKVVNGILISRSGLSVTEKYKEEIRIIYRNNLNNNSLQNQRTFSGKFGFYLHVNKNEALSFINELKREN